jgi:hypothetical protein
MAVDDRLERFGDVGRRVDVVELAGGDDRCQQSPVFCPDFMTGEESARMNHGYQLLSVAMAAIAIISVFQQARWAIFSASFTIVAIFFFACWLVWRDLHKLARRVKEIELDVNARAGEHLLVWETINKLLVGDSTAGADLIARTWPDQG